MLSWMLAPNLPDARPRPGPVRPKTITPINKYRVFMKVAYPLNRIKLSYSSKAVIAAFLGVIPCFFTLCLVEEG